MNPMRPLPTGWMPGLVQWAALHQDFGKVVDLHLSLRRFKAYYAEGQTSRDWDARFERWVIEDYQRLAPPNANVTDDLGIPLTQHKTNLTLTPDDPGYVSPELLATWARFTEGGADEEQ